jgi:hypothetical protein
MLLHHFAAAAPIHLAFDFAANCQLYSTFYLMPNAAIFSNFDINNLARANFAHVTRLAAAGRIKGRLIKHDNSSATFKVRVHNACREMRKARLAPIKFFSHTSVTLRMGLENEKRCYAPCFPLCNQTKPEFDLSGVS